MNFKLLRYIARHFSIAGNNRRFLNFARSVAFISVMLGSMALIISFSVLNGFEYSLKNKAVEFTSHVMLKTYNKQPIRNFDSVMKEIRMNFKEVKKIAPVIEREGLAGSGAFVEGVVIRGLNRKYDITNLHKNIIRGSFSFSSPNADEIVIGKRLARKLGVKLGSEIVIYAIKGSANKKMEMPEIEKFKVTGIYETGMAQYDDIFVYIPFGKAISFFKMPKNSATSFDILLYDINDASKVASELNRDLGFPYYSFTVFDMHSAIFAWIELQKAPIPLVLGLISIVAVFNIVTILLITVVEKTHSIGILRALGMGRKDIIKIFIIQGTTIGLAGTLTGCGIGLLFGWLQQTYKIITLKGDIYFLDSLPIKFEAWHFIIVIGLSLILSFLATLIPSFIAAKIRPIKAIRFK